MAVRAAWGRRHEIRFTVGRAGDIRRRMVEPLRMGRKGDGQRHNDCYRERTFHTHLQGPASSQRLFLLQHELPHVGEEVGAVDVSLGIEGNPFG